MPTILFTDIEGSTRVWEEGREAMASALASHDEILANACDRGVARCAYTRTLVMTADAMRTVVRRQIEYGGKLGRPSGSCE